LASHLPLLCVACGGSEWITVACIGVVTGVVQNTGYQRIHLRGSQRIHLRGLLYNIPLGLALRLLLLLLLSFELAWHHEVPPQRGANVIKALRLDATIVGITFLAARIHLAFVRILRVAASSPCTAWCTAAFCLGAVATLVARHRGVVCAAFAGSVVILKIQSSGARYFDLARRLSQIGLLAGMRIYNVSRGRPAARQGLRRVLGRRSAGAHEDQQGRGNLRCCAACPHVLVSGNLAHPFCHGVLY
jgi:hypothetical protein